jgi:nicotinamidase/pyrazinamidase
MKTLIIIDVQNDFMPGGPLEVPEGNMILPVINRIQPLFDLIVATQDWHPGDHESFASNHRDKKPFETIDLNGVQQILWPDHCRQGSEGAAFDRRLQTNRIAAIFREGMDRYVDSYSGFYDNNHKLSTGLAG